MSADKQRHWWPADWADEVMPPGRPAPDDFIIDADGHYWLGYAFDAKDASDQDKRYFSRRLERGDIVNFISCDDLGEAEIAIKSDGSFDIVSGAISPAATHFWCPGDMDTLAGSIEAFARQYVGDECPAIVTLAMARWSDSVPHRLVIDFRDFAAKPRFEVVSVAEARQ